MNGTAMKVSPVNMESRKALEIRSGDTVKVWSKVQEKGKTRLQAFEGIVLARKHGAEAGATFTVRKVSDGVGVEKIFPLYSPSIDKIEILRRAKVRRAKLYHIREKVAREIKRQMRDALMLGISSVSEMGEEKERVETKKRKDDADAKAVEEAAAAEAEAALKAAEAAVGDAAEKKE